MFTVESIMDLFLTESVIDKANGTKAKRRGLDIVQAICKITNLLITVCIRLGTIDYINTIVPVVSPKINHFRREVFPISTITKKGNFINKYKTIRIIDKSESIEVKLIATLYIEITVHSIIFFKILLGEFC